MLLRRLPLLILLCVPVLTNAQAPASDRERGLYLGAGVGHAELVLEDDVNATVDFKGDEPTLRAGFLAWAWTSL